MKNKKHLVKLSIITLFLIVSVIAQVPNKISYQGLLTTSAGTPVQDGIYDLKFDLYNLPEGGDLRYTETQNDVSVKSGTFSVILRLPSAIFAESIFVEVTVLDGPGISSPITFSPRSALTSASYAFRADTASYAKNVVCAGTFIKIIDGDFPAFDPQVDISITHEGFKFLPANQIVVTANAYVSVTGIPGNIPMKISARPYNSGNLHIALNLHPSECNAYSGKAVRFYYILTVINN